MRYAILNKNYIVENIIEAENDFAKNYLSVLIEQSDVSMGDKYDVSIRWFVDSNNNKRMQNSELNEVDNATVDMIRQQYSLTDEIKLLRLNQVDPQSISDEFSEYNNYVESCRQNGKVVKQTILDDYYKHLLLFELGET